MPHRHARRTPVASGEHEQCGRRSSRLQRHAEKKHPVAVFGLRVQLRGALRLTRTTPGLSVYLSGGVAVWLVLHVLLDHGLADSALGALAVGAVRILGLAVVVVLYFRRTGQLAQGWAELRRLREVLQDPPHVCTHQADFRAWLVRLLRWSLRVEEYRHEPRRR